MLLLILPILKKKMVSQKKIRCHETTWVKDKKKYFVCFITHDWLFGDDSYFLMLLIERDDKKY